jgi:mono/diheme cytochrome c family protein
VYTARCAACHGPRGAGDGPAAAALQPHPRSFRDPEWQRTVTDDGIRQVILHGGTARRLSPLMPAQPDLGPDDLNALIRYIRAQGD